MVLYTIYCFWLYMAAVLCVKLLSVLSASSYFSFLRCFLFWGWKCSARRQQMASLLFKFPVFGIVYGISSSMVPPSHLLLRPPLTNPALVRSINNKESFPQTTEIHYRLLQTDGKERRELNSKWCLNLNGNDALKRTRLRGCGGGE